MTRSKGIGSYVEVYGSVIPRVLPWAIVGAAQGVVLKWAARNYSAFVIFEHFSNGGAWAHPYAFHVFGMLLGACASTTGFSP